MFHLIKRRHHFRLLTSQAIIVVIVVIGLRDPINNKYICIYKYVLQNVKQIVKKCLV